jgi:hypothetical protein
MKYYSHLLSGEEIDGVLTLEEGASFPVSCDRKDFLVLGSNKVLARSCTKHMYEILLYIIGGNRVDGWFYKGLLITGLPGDGMVRERSFAENMSMRADRRSFNNSRSPLSTSCISS